MDFAFICGRSGPWGWADFAATFQMWLAMMIAMMGPTLWPWLKRLAHQASEESGAPAAARLSLFVAGYAVSWSGFGIVATLLQWAASSAGLTAQAALGRPWLLASGLMLVGLYQWTPLKEACLRHCQSPLGFFLTHWRDGRRGAVIMGAHHGLHCVGCCWPLMALMLVTGTMSLPWMAAVGAFVLAEMYVPRLGWLTRTAGLALITAGGGLLVLA